MDRATEMSQKGGLFVLEGLWRVLLRFSDLGS